jgi:DNA polymerase III subunit gamma/tau
MEKFLVSARKYRPQTFETVVGQSHITTTLKNAIKNNQLAHAFLFCGPRGVGKTTCARILAKTINCENRQPDGEACNTCHSCVSFNEGSSLNIHELDAASNNSVDDIRELVNQVRFAPQAGKYKVYIIDEVHMLSSSAFNAFLKTLEEPPPYAIFILATTEKHKILPTILSRCQIFDFKRITLNDTVEHIQDICKKEGINADKAALQLIAQKSEGCMRDALSILDKIVSFTNGELHYTNTLEHLNILDEDYYFKLMDCMLQQDLSGAMLLYDDINRKGFEGDLVLDGYMEFIRNLLVCRDEKVVVLLDVVESFKEKYLATAKKISQGFLISALNILNETAINYKSARNKRLHVELALIKLCYLQQAISLTSGNGKKKLIDDAKPVAFKNIAPLELKSKPQKATPAYKPAQTGATLVIDAPASLSGVAENDFDYGPQPDGKKEEKVLPAKPTVKAGNRLGALDKIRQQIKSKETGHEQYADEPLQLETLQAAWNKFTQQLKDKRNVAAQSFDRAHLQVEDEKTFIAITANSLEQKFIEKERNNACLFLQEQLHNKSIRFTIRIDENAAEKIVVALPPSTKEQFLSMTEKYPLVKELKDRLRLELDY